MVLLFEVMVLVLFVMVLYPVLGAISLSFKLLFLVFGAIVLVLFEVIFFWFLWLSEV